MDNVEKSEIENVVEVQKDEAPVADAQANEEIQPIGKDEEKNELSAMESQKGLLVVEEEAKEQNDAAEKDEQKEAVQQPEQPAAPKKKTVEIAALLDAALQASAVSPAVSEDDEPEPEGDDEPEPEGEEPEPEDAPDAEGPLEMNKTEDSVNSDASPVEALNPLQPKEQNSLRLPIQPATDILKGSQNPSEGAKVDAVDPEKSEAPQTDEIQAEMETKEAMEVKEAKEVMEANEAKEVVEANETMETMQSKQDKEAMETNEAMETMESKEDKEAMEANEAVETMQSKQDKEAKDEAAAIEAPVTFLFSGNSTNVSSTNAILPVKGNVFETAELSVKIVNPMVDVNKDEKKVEDDEEPKTEEPPKKKAKVEEATNVEAKNEDDQDDQMAVEEQPKKDKEAEEEAKRVPQEWCPNDMNVNGSNVTIKCRLEEPSGPSTKGNFWVLPTQSAYLYADNLSSSAMIIDIDIGPGFSIDGWTYQRTVTLSPNEQLAEQLPIGLRTGAAETMNAGLKVAEEDNYVEIVITKAS